MRNIKTLLFYCMLSVLLIISNSIRAQDASTCGNAPPVANETLKGDIRGKAELLSKFIGGSELSGKIETTRTEIFSKYPEAETSRWNAFFQFQVCVLVMSDKSKTQAQKLDALKETQREFSKPIVKKVTVVIRSGKKWIDNQAFGPVDGSLGNIQIKIDGKLLVKHSLDQPFGSHKLALTIGDHDFEFIGKIYGMHNSAILKDNCIGTFTVDEPSTFAPFIVIERNELDGKFVSCSLDPT